MTECTETNEVLVPFSWEQSKNATRTRTRFEARLAKNIADACRSHGLRCTVKRGWGRLHVCSPDPGILDPLGRVFGISSYSVVEGRCDASLSEIVDLGHRLYADRVQGRRFAVRARRTGEHDFNSYDIQRELGAVLNPGATVDLSNPEVEVRVEVRDREAYFVGRPRAGAAGLPLGVQGKAVVLISGGFDSAVAAWMVLRRGVEAEYLFCNLGGAAYKRLTIEVVKVLADRWSYGTQPKLHVVDFESVVEGFQSTVKPSYWQVTLKRMMYLAAAAVAEEVGADAIVTGESIGQVSSQTLANLRAIDAIAPLPVLRPLLGFDKDQILDRARVIETHDLSARVREYCAIVPDRPVTAARSERVAAMEEGIDQAVLSRAVADRQMLRLRGLDTADLVGSHLFVSEIPANAVVIDARDAEAFLAWHWPGAEHRAYDELSREFAGLARDRTYVLYCSEGILTAHLAERMQSKGYEAYSFRGGVRSLRRHGESVATTSIDGAC
ncbi:MAG: tRNA 4-thiouridine(8) synthase ThiI [Gemmatimonadales bacterium]